MNFGGLHEVASVAFERMVYSLAEGLLLTFVVAIALRLLPAKASQTRFAVWLSALFGIVVVTVFGLRGASGAQAMHSASLFSLPISVALGAFALWALIATLGVVRIGLGLWQLRKLRRQCEAVGELELPESAREMVKAFQSVRPVTILRASDSHSPKAVGFFHPAVILPAWLLNHGTGDELKHVLLHELAHLRRRDDWTNLLQQVVKALFFFHPAIWWMERELALSREQACDDAALEQAADAQDYARSLALVAEKSFIQRQVALAQAILGRAHQLTQRVTRILDPKRPTRNRIWKPAVPLVAVAAAACGFSTSWTPALVGIQDTASRQTASVQTAGMQAAPAVLSNARSNTAYSTASEPAQPATFSVKAWPAGMKFDPAMKAARHRQKTVPASHEPSHGASHELRMIASTSAAADRKQKPKTNSPVVMAKYSASPQGEIANSRRNGSPAAKADEAVDGLVVLVATQQTIVADRNGWHVEVSEVRWVVPAKAFYKPAPNKT
jgi:beta-lactamase regulating signal transducer with metallopeptidase domain